jgi:hypothetical protein
MFCSVAEEEEAEEEAAEFQAYYIRTSWTALRAIDLKIDKLCVYCSRAVVIARFTHVV